MGESERYSRDTINRLAAKFLMKQIYQKSSAFTLIEILIASAIFVTVTVITTSIATSSVGYEARLSANRDAFEDSRKLSDILTRDVREVKSSTFTLAGNTYSSGVALFNCSTACTAVASSLPSSFADSPVANTLVLQSNGIYKIYHTKINVLNGELYFSTTSTLSDLPLYLTGTLTADSKNIISNIKCDTVVDFSGFIPSSGSTIKQQPYVNFRVQSKTKDYDSLVDQPDKRASTVIQSQVTLRNYN